MKRQLWPAVRFMGFLIEIELQRPLAGEVCMNDIVRIHPEVDFSPECPRDGTKLTISNVAIPGMRSLVDTVCLQCDSRYYVDLPVSHALWNRVSLDQKTLELYNTREPNWITEPLRRAFLNQESRDLTPIVHKFFHAERIVIVNCMDFVYGHALLKLLNTQKHIEQSPELGCCVLVSPELVDLVPAGVAEIWEFPVLIGEHWKWFSSLRRWVDGYIKQRQECFLSRAYSHPSSRGNDLRRYVRNLPDLSEQLERSNPVIMFCHREDRLWGRTLGDQQRNLQTLLDKLSEIFPGLAFVLLGFGRQNRLHNSAAKLIDLRIEKFDRVVARNWLAHMQAADCCIGVMGSNMLLPSGLAKATVNLVQRTRSLNFFQDILFTGCDTDVRLAFLKYRFIFGDSTLTDVKVSAVIDAVTSIFAHNERSAYWFTIGDTRQENFTRSNSEVHAQALRYRRAQALTDQDAV
jgi:hypothetical protein